MKKAVITKCLFLVLFIFIMKLSFNSQWLQRRNLVLESTDQENLEAEFWLQKINGSDHAKNFVNVIDLNSHLLPRDLYKPIKCRKSNMYIVRTTLCVHDLERDVHVSGSIWRDGVWEEHILKPFVDYIFKHQDYLVIDIGAQIGQYSLFAAQMGLRVLTVEPFYDNILRLHKAAHIEKLEDKITLIQNALSNKRNETKLLQPVKNNIGGQGLLDNLHSTYIRNSNNKYLVQTILFDDLVPYIPRTNENEIYKKAVLKIDIEGFEPFAFKQAAKFFDAIDIQIIFMEWGVFMREPSLHYYILDMVEFLVSRNYSAYGNDEYLEPIKWGSWGAWDVIWKKRHM